MTSSNPNSNPNANANTGPTFRPFAVNRKGFVKFIPANAVDVGKASILQKEQVSATSIELFWDDSGGETFRLQVSTDGGTTFSDLTTTSDLTFTHTGLTGGTTYTYRVRAEKGEKVGEYSEIASKTVETVPSAPTGFTATSSFADSVSLSWTDNSSGTGQETGFDIEVSTNAGSTYSSVTTTAQNAISYSHTGRVESTAYLYRIRATNSAGSSSWVTASSVTTPAAVQSFTATAASSTQINLSWTDKSGVETGFRIERSTDNTNWSLVTTTAANATSFSDTGLTASTLYYYRIRSDSYNGTSNSAWYTANATTQSSTYNVEYLVVAGGGGGAKSAASTAGGGGGGAGGYTTATGFSLNTGTSYTITVGAGGGSAAAGNSSVFSTITSNGGSAGGTYGGGSSGGGTFGVNAGGGGGSNYPWPGGGGGGAGGAGASGSGTTIAGDGGAGRSSSITGTAVTRAGGGGGSIAFGNGGSGYDAGDGGSGGGGKGAGEGSGAVAGTANTGSGGGAGSFYASNGAAGGSGVVIIRMPTANYSGTTTGSPTVTTSGSDTILTYNASGTYTA